MSEPQSISAAIGEQCDVCGQDVPKDDVVKAELTVAGAMCPTAMTFHTACYEKAAQMWQPDPDSYCTVDPLFPETGKWVVPEEARPESWVPYTGPERPSERDAGPERPSERDAGPERPSERDGDGG